MNIPRKIHYCWFGGKEKPQEVLRMISTWRAVMPDYEIKEWNEDNFDYNQFTYSREAYAMGDYAFVADVCRVYVLTTEGGVYLDTDIEARKPFDPYLNNNSFCGYEHQGIGTGVIGAEKGCAWTQRFLDFYAHKHYINNFGHPVRTPNVRLLSNVILPTVSKAEHPEVYPVDYFCARNWKTGEYQITDNTVCIHHYGASWRRNKTLGQRIRIIIKGLKARYLSAKS